MEGSGHLPAATASATASASATGTFWNPKIPARDGGFWNPKTAIRSSIAFPDIGNSFQKFSAKLLPESLSQSQPTVDVVCQIGRDGLMIFDSASATQMLRIYPLQDIAKCDVVDSSVFELWTNNNSSDGQPTIIKLQSDRAGDLLDAVTAASMELLGFTDWMYLIKHGCEDDSMGQAVVYGDGPRENVVSRAQVPTILLKSGHIIEMQERKIKAQWCAPVIPPYNSAATDPKDVYPLGKIIRAGEWRYLRDIIELMERGEEVKYDAPYPTYVCHRIKRLWGTKDEAGRAKLGCLLSYITNLFKFTKLHYGRYRSIGEANIPPVLFRRFCDLFIVPETGLLNSILVGSYLLVLCLFVDSFRSCLDGHLPLLWPLSDYDREIFERLGCKLSRREDRLGIDAELCPPLELPKEWFGGIYRKEAMERWRRRKNSKKIEKEQKRMKNGLGLNETRQPPQQPGQDGVI